MPWPAGRSACYAPRTEAASRAPGLAPLAAAQADRLLRPGIHRALSPLPRPPPCLGTKAPEVLGPEAAVTQASCWPGRAVPRTVLGGTRAAGACCSPRAGARTRAPEPESRPGWVTQPAQAVCLSRRTRARACAGGAGIAEARGQTSSSAAEQTLHAGHGEAGAQGTALRLALASPAQPCSERPCPGAVWQQRRHRRGCALLCPGCRHLLSSA